MSTFFSSVFWWYIWLESVAKDTSQGAKVLGDVSIQSCTSKQRMSCLWSEFHTKNQITQPVPEVGGQRVGQLPTMGFKISVYFFKILTNASFDTVDIIYMLRIKITSRSATAPPKNSQIMLY